MKAIISQIQTIQLTDVPMIPLWYNGVWAQTDNTYWTNWPSSAEGAPKYVPATWNGYWNMGAVLMLTELEPVAAE
jgi:peptide/nickel transport system substrate-binding protein